MSDPKRIYDARRGDLASQLIGAARRETPSTRSRRRAQATVALLASGATLSSASAGAAATLVSPLVKTVLVWLGLGIAAGGTFGLAAVEISQPVGAAPSPRAAAPRQWEPAPAAPPRAAAAPRESAPPPSVEPVIPPPAPVAPPRSLRPSAVVQASEPAPASAPLPSLARELELIDRARAALRVRDVVGARRALEVHERSFPAPQFGPEALALRIELLEAERLTGAAEQLRQHFLTVYPGHPLAARLRR